MMQAIHSVAGARRAEKEYNTDGVNNIMARIGARKTITALGAMTLVAILFAGCTEKQDPIKRNVELGTQALEEGDWSRARDAFTDALAKNDRLVDAFYGRAAATLAQAEEHYKLALAAATTSDVERAQEEAQRADVLFDQANDDCDDALEIDPDFADAYYVKGVIAQYQGEWNEGINAFTECVRLSPNRAEAYHRRGEIYDHIGDYINSTVDFKKASELGYVKKDAVTSDSPTLDEDDMSELNYDATESGASGN